MRTERKPIETRDKKAENSSYVMYQCTVIRKTSTVITITKQKLFPSFLERKKNRMTNEELKPIHGVALLGMNIVEFLSFFHYVQQNGLFLPYSTLLSERNCYKCAPKKGSEHSRQIISKLRQSTYLCQLFSCFCRCCTFYRLFCTSHGRCFILIKYHESDTLSEIIAMVNAITAKISRIRNFHFFIMEIVLYTFYFHSSYYLVNPFACYRCLLK